MLETPFWASCWGVKLTYLEIRYFHDSFQIANNHAFSLVFTNTKRTNETEILVFPNIQCYKKSINNEEDPSGRLS